MKTLVVILSGIVTVFGIGCAALSYYITPADIDKEAVAYAVKAGVADPNDYRGYQNLYKAEKLNVDVGEAHSMYQFNFEQLIAKDNFDYSRHSQSVAANLVAGKQREEALFGPTGILSMGLTLAGFGTLTGYLGLMRKRPRDIAKEEADKLLAEATTEKQKQFAQLVLGIKKFMDTYKDDPTNPTLVKLKECLDDKQLPETKVAVATVLKTTPM